MVFPMEDTVRRRVLLGTAGAVGVIALAGCLSSDDDDPDAGTGDSDSSDTETGDAATSDADTGEGDITESEIPDLPDGLSESGVDHEALVQTHSEMMRSQSFTLYLREERDGQLYGERRTQVASGDERLYRHGEAGPDAAEFEEIEEYAEGQTHYVREDGEKETGEGTFEELREMEIDELSYSLPRIFERMEFADPEYADGAFVATFLEDDESGFDIEDGYVEVNEHGIIEHLELDGEPDGYWLDLGFEDVGTTTVETPDWV